MLEVGKFYKFEIQSNENTIFYTGVVIDLTETHVSIQTIRNENIMLKIENIIQTREIPSSKLGRSLVE